jgi:NAD-dependent deacetylase
MTLQEIIDRSEKIVFFGGAGVSTESGIPDFRSADGIYNQGSTYPPEQIISHTFFVKKTEVFYEFYKDKMLYPEAKPNSCHKKLAELERAGLFFSETFETGFKISGTESEVGFTSRSLLKCSLRIRI